MLSHIIQLSIRNKFLVILFVLALVAIGIYSMMNLPIDAVPDITNNQVQVVTVSPSLAAREVEQFITYPIELQMANVQDVEEIRSISRYGLSVVTVVFAEKVPILDARQLVGQQLQLAVQEIPEGYGEPSLMPITTGLGEIYQYTLEVDEAYAHKYSATELRTIHDWVVKRQLNGIPGIVEISSFGGFLKQYEVSVDPRLLNSFNLNLLDVNNALQSNNQNTGGSYIQKGPYAYYIRANGLIETTTDIENIVVAVRDNIPVLIRDVAEVQIGHPPRFGAMTKDGKGEAVGGITLMLKGGNASKVIAEVKERMEQVQKNLPEGISIKPYLDRSVLVDKVIHTVSKNLIEGGLIVILVLILLLGNFRAGLIVASVIPLSMLVAFSLMKAFGVTATVMSLGAIDFGLIVDATVIIVESIIYQFEQRKSRMQPNEKDELVLNTTLRIRNSALFGAIIILIVYFPILTLTGIEGKMFRPMALTVIFAIIGALVLSFTYIPVMSALFLKVSHSEKPKLADRIMALMYRSYRPIFMWALRFKTLVLAMTLVVLVATIFVFRNLGAEFLPDLDEGDLAMQMTIPPGSSLSESIRTSTKAEKILLDNFPEVKTVVSKIGTAEVPTDPMAIEDADIMIVLKPRKEWVSAHTREELVNKMKEKLEVVIGASFEFTQPIQLRFNELLTGAKSDVVVKIYGEDLKVLFEKANEVAFLIKDIPGAADIKVEQIEGLPQLVIDYNRRQMARYGISVEDVNTMIRTALAGENVGVIFEGERKFDLVVRLQDEYRNDYNEFQNLLIKTPGGVQVPLQELANITFVESPMQISRDNTHRRISIGINVRNRDVKSLVDEVQQTLDRQLVLPIGYYLDYGGKFENLQSAMLRLKIVVPLALLLIFLMLYFAFGTFKQAAMILTTIPLSIIGGVLALWIRGLPFSISAGIGFIALFGVAVLDGIVLINHLNELKVKGMGNITERLIAATKNRLRPVTVTSAVASLGFLPMAIATSSGAEVQRPLATVVIGGIITSTFLTMIILPLVYYYFEKGIRLKVPKSISTIVLFIFLGGWTTALHASDTVSLSRAVELMEQNHPSLQNLLLEKQQTEYMRRAAFDLGTTEAVYQYGQINSEANDYSLTVGQNFGNLMGIPAERNMYQKEGMAVQSRYNYLYHSLTLQLTEYYYTYQVASAKLSAINSTTRLFEQTRQIAQKRYRVGETGEWPTLTYEMVFAKINRMRDAVRMEQQKQLSMLNNLVFSDTMVVPESPSPLKLLETVNMQTVDHVQSGRQAGVLKSEIDLLQAKVKWEKSFFFPDLYAGYFNQQIDRQTGFQGWEAGVSLPLWFTSQQKHVQAGKVQVAIAENNYRQHVFENQLHVQLLQQQFSLLQKQLDEFELIILPAAKHNIQQATQLYQSASITLMEYIMAVEQSLTTELDYYDGIIEYNSILLQIRQITE